MQLEAVVSGISSVEMIFYLNYSPVYSLTEIQFHNLRPYYLKKGGSVFLDNAYGFLFEVNEGNSHGAEGNRAPEIQLTMFRLLIIDTPFPELSNRRAHRGTYPAT